MKRISKNEQGFSFVEVVLVLVVVAVLGIVSWLVYKDHHKTMTDASNKHATTNKTTASSTSPTQTASVSPYAGWRTAALKYEKISYRYPSSWRLTDKSSNANSCVTPGSDEIILTSPTKEQVILQTGIDCIGDAGATSFGAVQINALDQKLYLAFEHDNGEGGPSPTYPQYACLAPSASPTTPLAFTSRNIHGTSKGLYPFNSFCYYPYDYLSQASAPTELISSIEHSADFNTAKLIFESMKY